MFLRVALKSVLPFILKSQGKAKIYQVNIDNICIHMLKN